MTVSAAPFLTVRSPAMVSARALASTPISNVPLEPCPTVSELMEASTSRVIAVPSAIVTSALVFGGTPLSQFVPTLQFPVWTDMYETAGVVA